MKNEIIYKVGDLKHIIKESSLKLMPKMGDGVIKSDAENNKKYYKDTENKIKDFNKEAKKANDNSLDEKIDDNKTSMDYSFDFEPEKSFKDRVKSLVKGYSSPLEEKNKIEKTGDFDKNEEIYDQLKKSHENLAKNTLSGKKAGLTSRELPDEAFDKDSMYENVKKLFFKHTKFLGEEHMLSRVPDEFKKNNERFVMKDMNDNEYLVEWHIDQVNSISEGKVLSYRNKRLVSEEMNRIKNLISYKSSDYFNQSTSKLRESQNDEMIKMLNDSKKINN